MASLLADDVFFDSLYATLAAWGLHRMGPSKTKLRELRRYGRASALRRRVWTSWRG